MRRREAEARSACEMATFGAGPQNPHRRPRHTRWNGSHRGGERLPRELILRKVAKELRHLGSEVGGIHPSEQKGRSLVGSGRPAKTEIDPIRMEGVEDPEGFGDSERRVSQVDALTLGLGAALGLLAVWGTTAFSAMVMALAVPWPTPDTCALTVPWVWVLPPTDCCWKSSRGTVV